MLQLRDAQAVLVVPTHPEALEPLQAARRNLLEAPFLQVLRTWRSAAMHHLTISIDCLLPAFKEHVANN